MVTVISDTIQEFLGVRYYLCGRYFQRNGVRLHRTVWEHVWGRPVPDGHDVHHADHDRSNNQPGNLELLESTRHLSHHSSDPENIARIKSQLDKAREAAANWHRSDTGRQWHSEHYDKHLRERMGQKVEKTCQQCGAQYLTVFPKAEQSRFCHPNCKARALRARRAAERKR